MTQATNSQIAMWRAAIALAWSDHQLDAGEKECLTQFFDRNVRLSTEQKALLKQDILTPCSFDDAWNQITEKQDRAQLIDILPTLFHADGNYSDAEKAKYEKILSDHLATLDVSTATEIARMAEEHRARRAKEEQEKLKSMSRAARLVYLLEEKWL